MKRSLSWALPVSLLVPALAWAQSAFVGTWKANLENNLQLPQKPSEYLLTGGVYQCKSCLPVISVPADGRDHAVKDSPYYDSVAVKVVDANTIAQTRKKAGKTVTTDTFKVSADGKTASFETTDSSVSSGAPVKYSGQDVRVASGPAGSHAISGSWRTVKLDSVSDNGLLTTWALSGNTLKMSSPLGQSYSAPLDGTDVPFVGDPGQTSVSMKKVDDRTLDETDKRDGKVITTARLTASPDGKTIHVVWKDVLHGTDGSFDYIKQ
jgi:hypothetical protein